MEDCEYKAKVPGHVKRHEAMVHDIGVTFYLCGVNGCEYKAKTAGNVKIHKAAVHDIDVIFYLCGVRQSQ